jgi:hypothetical protein
MGMMPTKLAEDIYSVLTRYAEASPSYTSSELFIYNFGCVPNGYNKFKLNCVDGKRRTFIKDGDEYRLDGPGSSKANSIIKKIISDSNATAKVDDIKVGEV